MDAKRSQADPTGQPVRAVPNYRLAIAARLAVTAPGYATEPGQCQHFIREVIEAEYGLDYEEYRAGSAKEAGKLWKKSPYAVDPKEGSIIGDILYKVNCAGKFGHVGIRIPGNRVAENSSAHVQEGDARGFRSLEEFGKYDLIVRLPENGRHG
jgi:hypothetical protein